MRKAIVSVFLLAMVSLAFNASAQVTGSLGYSHIDDDITLGAVQGTIGYRIHANTGASGEGYFIPEARVGVGVRDDTFLGVDVELDHYYGIAPRYQYETDGGFYAFGMGSYVRYSFSASSGNVSLEDSSWEFGFGGGVGLILTQNSAIEVSYERIDDGDVFNASWRFGF